MLELYLRITLAIPTALRRQAHQFGINRPSGPEMVPRSW
jgi:hypothetical protein